MNIIGLPALVGTYDNYIWVIHNNANAWVVDPGESQQVLDYLEQHQLQLQAILITHQHFDHVDGIDALLTAYPNTTIYGPAKSNLASIQIKCNENDVIKLAEDLQFNVLETPGHTKDHITFYNDQLLFCGDTLFTGGCGRILGGTAQQFSQSILKLRELPDELQFFSAHEYTVDNLGFAKLAEPENEELAKRIAQTSIHYPSLHQGAQSTLGEEKTTNPFLRFDSPQLQKKLLERGAQNSAESLFSELRAWKDEYDHNH